jgi:non-ribosomal peptide synthetase component F
MWGALFYGGRLVVVPGGVARSPQDFYELLCEEGVTVLNQTPGAFRQLIALQSESDLSHELRYVIFGGEALEARMLAPWMERNGADRTRLVNMYGITEITVHGTYHVITAEE